MEKKMKVTLLFFARYREQLGCSRESLNLPVDVNTVKSLTGFLSTRGDNWSSVFNEQTVICAINQTVTNIAAEIKEGDEIAFFPPVTGG